MPKFSTDILHRVLDAYKMGLFPMADEKDTDDFAWYQPYHRAILPLQTLHISRKLKQLLRGKGYIVTVNQDFEKIIHHCQNSPLRVTEGSWINTPIMNLFCALHHAGLAHSVEVRDLEGHIIGGLYGLSIGRVFFGESMVSLQPNTSKIALIYLAAILWHQGFEILDSQIANDHMAQFGLIEIPHDDYLPLLHAATNKNADFMSSSMPDLRILMEDYLKCRESGNRP
jgi:leucyl/phenylalanyl-tRNA--protein transferase